MSLKLLQGFACLILLLAPTSCLIGIDAGPLITFQSTFDCMKQQGYQFSNIRAFTLQGIDLDLSVRDTLIYSQKAGIPGDLFIRPCRGKSARFQIDAVVLVIDSQYYNRFWLSLVPNPNKGCEWHSDKKSNCDYIKEMLKQIKYFEEDAGIYTSAKHYKQIFGNYECDLSEFPLIYEQPDGAPTFEGYEQIGSWKTPYGKMFQNDQYACGINVNKVYRKGDGNLEVE